MATTIDWIIKLYRTAGAARYGMEAVNQEQHALQCGVLAQQADASEALVAAALLHDLGHLVTESLPGAAPARDALHEFRALPILRPIFSSAVIAPITMHVAAKRYLCAAEPGYQATLSAASRHSLSLQGGPLVAEEAARFLARPFARDAVQLRLWDDQAKDAARPTPGWEHFRGLLERVSMLHAMPA